MCTSLRMMVLLSHPSRHMRQFPIEALPQLQIPLPIGPPNNKPVLKRTVHEQIAQIQVCLFLLCSLVELVDQSEDFVVGPHDSLVLGYSDLVDGVEQAQGLGEGVGGVGVGHFVKWGWGVVVW